MRKYLIFFVLLITACASAKIDKAIKRKMIVAHGSMVTIFGYRVPDEHQVCIEIWDNGDFTHTQCTDLKSVRFFITGLEKAQVHAH